MPTLKHDKVTVESFFQENGEALHLRLVSPEVDMNRVIREPTVNRPGLALTGFLKYFAYKRIQVLGNAEAFYLKSLDEA